MKFEIDSEQQAKLVKWAGNHPCILWSVGAIGGALTYSFTPTNLGLVFKVECACGSLLDLTNYESW